MTTNTAHTPQRGQSTQRPFRFAHGAAFAACMTALLVAKPAAAQEFTLHAEGAAAFWLDKPQSERFTPGGYLAVRPGVAIGRVFSLQWSYAMLGTAAKKPFTEPGVAHFFSGGLRLRPFATLRPETENLGGFWIDANVGYVRTGDLNRLGVDAGIGYGFQVAPWLALGPSVRYGQVIQPDHIIGRDPNDAQFLNAGLTLTFGPAHKVDVEEEPQPECAPTPECVQEDKECAPTPECVQAAPVGCPDGDKDGVCDSADRCPTQAGSAGTFGCPVDPCTGQPIEVLVQFGYDSTSLPIPKKNDPQTMDPVLDAVAAAIAQNPTCRVCIVGHASEEGADDYNMDLSRRRASAVQAYMTARGVAKARIPSTGLGEQCQMVPESSAVMNRRVDFFRLDEGEACPTDCSK